MIPAATPNTDKVNLRIYEFKRGRSLTFCCGVWGLGEWWLGVWPLCIWSLGVWAFGIWSVGVWSLGL